MNKGLCDALSLKIDMPTVNNIKTEDLPQDRLAELLEAIDQDPDIHAANIVKLALFTGMRRGEIFKLKWDDVDFDRGFIHIRDPKGGPSQKIPLNDTARDLLQNLPRGDGLLVLPGRNGRERTAMNEQFAKRIKQQVGLPQELPSSARYETRLRLHARL
jgi:integrase